MSNRDEELIFDFMAAAEETGKRLDALIKMIPGLLQKTLSDEYRRSPWLATFPAEVERLNTVVQRSDSAAERTESATAHVERRIKTVCFIACLAAIIMPLAALGIAYWSLSDLRNQQVQLEQGNAALMAGIETATQMQKTLAETIARQKNEIQMLSSMAEVLKNETGGLDVVDNGDGSWDVVFPASAEFERRPWRNTAGRFVVPYAVSGK